MWAVGWHLPFSSFLMAGAHLAPSVTLSRWWPLLCSSFSTFSAKAPSASFPVRICSQEDSCLGYVTSLVVDNEKRGLVKQGLGLERGRRQAKIEFIRKKKLLYKWKALTYLCDFWWVIWRLQVLASSSLQWSWTRGWSVTLLPFDSLVIIYHPCFRRVSMSKTCSTSQSWLCYSQPAIWGRNK